MLTLELTELIEHRPRLEVWTAIGLPGGERVHLYKVLGAVPDALLSAFLDETRTAVQAPGRGVIWEVDAGDDGVQMVETHPAGRRVADILAQATTACPPAAALLLGRQVLEILRSVARANVSGLEPHGALSMHSVFVDAQGVVTVTGFAVRRLAAALEGSSAQPDADAVAQLIAALVTTHAQTDDPAARELEPLLAQSNGASMAGVDSLLERIDQALDRRKGVAESSLRAWLGGRSPRRALLDLLGLDAAPAPQRKPTALVELSSKGAPEPSVEADRTRTNLGPVPQGGWLGRRLGELRLDRKLGTGAFGEVYHGYDAAGRECAVKILSPLAGRTSRVRLLREAQAGMSVRHENLVQVHDVGEADGVPYLVMEFVDGVTLRELIHREAPLEPSRAAHLVRQLADALSAIHAARSIHRDVKPANILITGAPPLETLKLGDLGLVRLESPEITQLTAAKPLGTPMYMAPEQASAAHQAQPAADMYSVGVILFELISGQPPFRSRGVIDVLDEHQNAAPPEPPAADGLGAIALRLLAKSPDRRPSALELIEMIDGFGEGATSTQGAGDGSVTDSHEGASLDDEEAGTDEDLFGAGTDPQAQLTERKLHEPTATRPLVVATQLLSSRSSLPAVASPPRTPVWAFALTLLLVSAIAAGIAFELSSRRATVEIPRVTTIDESHATTIDEPRGVAIVSPSPSTSPVPTIERVPTLAPLRAPDQVAPRRTAPPRTRESARSEEALIAQYGLKMSDLALLPDLARAAAAVSRTNTAAAREAEESRLRSLLTQPQLQSRLAKARLEQAQVHLSTLSDRLPVNQLSELESRYLKLMSALRAVKRDAPGEALASQIKTYYEEVYKLSR